MRPRSLKLRSLTFPTKVVSQVASAQWHSLCGMNRISVAFRSAKERAFAERKTTITAFTSQSECHWTDATRLAFEVEPWHVQRGCRIKSGHSASSHQIGDGA